MTNKTVLAMVAVGALAGPMAAQAVPVVYDFTGTGNLCTYTGVGTSENCSAQSFSGTISIDVLAADPVSGGASYIGSTQAYDYDGSWVQSDFLIQWGANSFNPGPVTGNNSTMQYAEVSNDHGGGYDRLMNGEYYQGHSNGTDYGAHAYLSRLTWDATWLSDLSFPQIGLASGTGNQVTFLNYSAVGGDRTGFRGYFNVSSLTAQTEDPPGGGDPTVPEPGTLALLGIGLTGLSLVRRRRAA